MDYRMFGYESFDRTALPSLFGLKPLRPGTSSPNHLFSLYGGFSGQTAFSGNNFDFGTSIKDKRTVTECHNQTNVIHSRYTLKDFEGKLKGMPGSTTT